MDQKEKAIKLHREWNGKLVTTSKAPVKDREALAIAYTPGVAEPCKIIAENLSELRFALPYHIRRVVRRDVILEVSQVEHGVARIFPGIVPVVEVPDDGASRRLRYIETSCQHVILPF